MFLFQVDIPIRKTLEVPIFLVNIHFQKTELRSQFNLNYNISNIMHLYTGDIQIRYYHFIPYILLFFRLSICMLSWETLYTVSGGAAAPYVTGLAEALVRRGHEVHVFTRASHGLKINVETVNGVVYHEVGT